MGSAGASGPARRRVVYSGRVQGVCFRAVSLDLSQGFEVVGYVRNLPDGSVELEAEGAAGEVDGLLAAIGRHFKGNITRAQTAVIPLRGGETRFEIRY
jgi:acylphosphatase